MTSAQRKGMAERVSVHALDDDRVLIRRRFVTEEEADAFMEALLDGGLDEVRMSVRVVREHLDDAWDIVRAELAMEAERCRAHAVQRSIRRSLPSSPRATGRSSC